MCGIIAYIGKEEVLPILLNGLTRLEYRGYDSAGLSILDKDNLKIIKTKGRVEDLKKIINAENLQGTTGIAHTRWATHGIPNETNAHPHFSCDKNIVLVHNGIIENYLTIKKYLESRGHKFITETDTEVIVHLIEEFNKNNNFEESVRLALNELKGAYGLAILNKNENKLIGARKGSPLIIGKNDRGIFIASDASAFLEYTNKVNYLEDGQMVIASESDYKINDIDNACIQKNLQEIDLSLEQIEKQGHDTFMHKEIFEQPETIHNSFRGRLLDGDIRLDGIDEILSQDRDYFKKLNRIIILACGTSWHAALYGKYILEAITKIPCEAEDAAEFRYRDPVLKENDFIIAVSQSGETADTRGAIEYVKEVSKKEDKKIRTFGIVNVVGSSIARLVDSGVYLHVGPEIGVASTKAFTGQTAIFYLFALKIAKEKKVIQKEEISRYLKDLEEIPEKVAQVLKKEPEIKKVAENYKNASHFLFLGRGTNYPVALEGALKLKELAYIPCDGLSASEMKHGPIALVDDNMASVFISPKDKTFEKILSNIQEIKSRKGKVIAITTDDTKLDNIADDIFYIPKTNEFLMPILSTIPLQLFAYHLALSKGCDVDKPRNLAKSVTVE
jgi:glutamine---fructose-6-phosphate transaminase (isomerizing)